MDIDESAAGKTKEFPISKQASTQLHSEPAYHIQYLTTIVVTQHCRRLLSNATEHIWTWRNKTLSEDRQHPENHKKLYKNLRNRPEYKLWLEAKSAGLIHLHWSESDPSAVHCPLRALSVLMHEKPPIFWWLSRLIHRTIC
jgi:hypothetical protein